MRVLITGGAGYIGSFVTLKLHRERHDVAVYDNLTTGRRSSVPADVRLITGDIRDSARLREAFGDVAPDAVIHLAGKKSVQHSFGELSEYVAVNVGGTAHLLECCVASSVRQFALSSSCAVYGSGTSPVSPYGETKSMAERLVHRYSEVSGMRFACLRYFNVVGAADDASLGEYAGESNLQLFPMAFRAALGRADRLQIFGDDYRTRDGTTIRDYVHVEDVADAHALLLDALHDPSLSGAYDVGSGVTATALEVAAEVRRVSGTSLPVEIASRRPGDPAEVRADPVAAARIGWAPRYGLAEMVRTAWDWHRKTPDSL